MPKQYDLLIFDWDGTLMDSAGVIVDSIQRACEDIGLPAPSERASRQIIGLGLIQALQTLLPDLPADDYPRLVERYRHHYLGLDGIWIPGRLRPQAAQSGRFEPLAEKPLDPGHRHCHRHCPELVPAENESGNGYAGSGPG